MAVFNRNMAFFRRKQGFRSVQKFADFLGEPRTKLVEYEKKAFPKDDFLKKLAQTFQIDLNLFIEEELTDLNFKRLFTTINEDVAQEPGDGVATFMEIIEQIALEASEHKRKILGIELTKHYMAALKENNQLSHELVSLYRKITDLIGS
jgi:transcriptional regulator with XRE-family HTH domain